MLTSETISTFLAGQKAILLLTLVVNIWGLVALYRNSRNRPSDYGLAFMLIGLFGWTGSILTLLLSAFLPAAHFAFFSTIVALTGFAWFALVYPEEHYKKHYFFFLIPGVIVGIASLIPRLFINGLVIDSHGYLSLIRNGALSWFSLYALLAGIIPTAILYFKKVHEQNIQTRQRLHWIATASLITFGGSFITNVFLPNFLDFPYLNSVGPAFSMMLATIIVWITSREHYVDSRNIFGIITGRLSLAAATIVIFSSISLLLALGSAESIVNHIIAATATAITIFVLGPSIRVFGESILLQKDRRNVEVIGATRGLVEALAHTTSVDEITTILGNIFEESLRSSFTRIILAEKISPDIAAHVAKIADIRTCTVNPPATYIIDGLSITMPNESDPHRLAVSALARALDAQVIVPITHHQHVIGILALGKKTDGGGYTKRDALMLATAARILSPLLIRASIIDHANEVTKALEEEVARRTLAIRHTQEEERDVLYGLALKVMNAAESLREALEQPHETNSETHVIFEDALQLTNRIEEIAKGLLTFTRAKSAPFTPSRTFELSAIVHGLIDGAQDIANKNGVSLRYDIAENVRCNGNSMSVHNALAQIIENAFRYLSEDGPKEIFISLSANNEQAIFVVRDTGIGIPGTMIDRIGTPLFNAHHEEDVEQGLGLGLAIAQGTIKQHGGTMVITSLNEKGTTVRVALPLENTRN